MVVTNLNKVFQTMYNNCSFFLNEEFINFKKICCKMNNLSINYDLKFLCI